MQPQFPIQIVSKKLVKPATPTPHNLRKMSISSLDQRQPPMHLSFAFFYPANDKDEAVKSAERSKQLQVSLSEVLTLFYPLAGRYIQDDILIDCNDDGVEYVEAKVSSHLNPVLKVDNKQLVPLIPRLSESSTSPLLAVQCNIFQCGGLAIGLSISKRIVDGFVFTKLIDGWATACRVGIDKLIHRPSFDLAVVLPPREMKPLPPLIPRLNVASKTFVFSGLAISNLREIAEVGGVKDSLKLGRRASRVQLVTALIWKALIGVAQAKHGEPRPSIITHLINMRGRTNLPISDHCCGSLSLPVIVRYTPEKKSKVELHELVRLVCDAIKNAVTECAKPRNGDEFFRMVDKAWKELRKANGRKCHPEEDDDELLTEPYFFTSTSGMPFYPDFGWGKPTRVTRVQTFSEILIQLTDTRHGDGIEAFICLDESEMRVFQQDPGVLAFTSQVEQHEDGSATHLRSKI